MKKIMYAEIEAASTDGEYVLSESSEAEYGEEWDGNVLGYVENLDLPEGIEIGGEYSGAIHNLPEGAVVLVNKGEPVEIYWVADAISN